jgi:hypothetical protein
MAPSLLKHLVMKFKACLAVFAMAWVLVPAYGQDQDMEGEREVLEQNERLEFRRESRPEGQRYSFEDYLEDLAAAARSEEPLPDNPVSQLASNDRREYKPLNPVPLLRW